MSDWRSVLAEMRRAADAPGRIDMRPWWRSLARREATGEPETVIRARAFERVLAEADPVLYEGEMVAGSVRGFRSGSPPDGVSAAEFESAVAGQLRIGQRDFVGGFDHTLADYPRLLAEGIDGVIARARESLAGRTAKREVDFLRSVVIALEALRAFALRYSRVAERAGSQELARRLEAVAGPPPRTLAEAAQLVWLTHVAFSSEGRHHMALGRLDQYLLPFYRRDLEEGRLDREGALDLLCHLWVRLEEVAEIQNICIGGLTPSGEDGTNELSYLALEATRLVRSPYTNLSARFHDGTPPEFHRACFEVIRTGVGFPAIFNDHVLQRGLVEIGVPPEVARDACMVGCIETMLAGRQQAWGDSRFNTPLFLLEALGEMRRGGERSWAHLQALFADAIARGVAGHARRINEHIARFPVERFPDPFLSALTRDCIARARDVNDDGAEFSRFHGIAVMGLATVADSLAALKRLVFEDRSVGLDDLCGALDADFAGREPLRQELINRPPKYGNDDPYVDSIAAWVVEITSGECLKHEVEGGGRFVSAMAANTQNISAGREVGATPDGRRARTPLSDAASPYFGRDERGPTAFLASVSVPDYHRVLTGSVINMRFDPRHFEGEDGVRRFGAMTRAFVRRRIPELQFNFTTNETLRAAQRDPESHRGLVVRVSGFSAYFVNLPREVQEDVIRRRAHG